MADFDGGPGNDSFTGGDGPDTINGNGGNDTLNGAGGNDTVNGGDGNDIVTGGAGADTVSGGDGDDVLASYLLDPQATSQYGNPVGISLDNFVDHDTLMGGAGSDLISAGYGDTVDGGGGGHDVLYISLLGATSGQTINFQQLGTGGTLSIGGGTISNIGTVLSIAGSDFDDVLTAYNASPYGSFGVVYGNGGNDTLLADYYTSVLDGGTGNDIVDGRPSQYLSALYGGDGDDTIYGAPNTFAKVYGGIGNDTIYSAGETYGGAGNDTIELQLGYYSGNVYGEAGDDIIHGVSNYNHIGNKISGGDGADTITGGVDNDFLSSGNLIAGTNGPLDIGAEHDHIEGGGGDDTIAIGYGDDADGGTGTDTLYLSLLGATSGMTLNTATIIGGASVWIGGGTIANFDAVGQLYGTNFADTLTLAAQDTSVAAHGGDGDDTVTALGNGGSTLYGDAGNDTLNGGGGIDVFYGGTGGDIMHGGGGDDRFVILTNGEVGVGEVIDGGGGNDVLQIGDGITRTAGPIDISNATVTGVEQLYSRLLASFSMTPGQLAAFGTIDVYNLYQGDPVTITMTASGTALLAGVRIVNSTMFVLANGANTFDLTGQAAQSTGVIVTGGTGADTLISGDNLDTLYGGDGNDILTGGFGDTLYGGLGDDRFIVTASQVGIGEFANQGFDTVVAGFTYTLGSDNIEALELSGTGDFNGTGNAANNVITGNSDANHLYGLNGNDILDGRGGADILEGGLGNDTYILTDLNDTIIENANQGTDTIQLTLAAGGAYTLQANIEHLTLIGGAFNVHGNASSNTIIGSDTGSTIYGEDGNDTLTGGTQTDYLIGGNNEDKLDGGGGADRLYGGAGFDVYFVDQQDDMVFENANEGTDLVNSTGNYYLFANVENLTLLGTGNIFGVGNELSNTIYANDGNNTLLGGAGNDTINGYGGNDIIYGEADRDVLVGGDGNDYIAGGDGNDVIRGDNGGDSLYGEAGDDTLTGGGDFVFDILVGGDGNDILYGDSGLADYDYLYGNAGNDSFYVDTGDDLTFEQAGEGIDTVYATVPGANNGVYLYANIENLVLLGATAFGVGNELDNAITGNASSNTLLGGAGADTINGKAGNDILFGQAGADVFVFEHGTKIDTIGDFAAGSDRIDLTAIGYSWSQVQNSLHEVGGNTAIDLGNGDIVILNGVTVAQLSQGDFILSSGSGAASAPVEAAVVAVEPVEAMAWHHMPWTGDTLKMMPAF